MAETPRSLVLNLFGDYLRYAGGEVKLGELTELMTAFGLEPATIRVSMSRLRKEGWFSTRKEGRETVYTLSGHMLEVLTQGRARIFRRREDPWSGRWTMVIYQVPESERAVREALRKQLAWIGFGQLSPSTWLAPHDLSLEAKELAARHECARVDVLWCGSDDADAAKDLARRCWDLETLGRDYRNFLATYGHLDNARGNLTKDGRQALVERTRLVNDFRRFPFRDPELPEQLQPESWPAPAAFSLFRRVHEQLGLQANAYVADLIGRPVHPGTPLHV
ncbi:phenylacetic acid degradation operon negative regulatory protein [Arthrobacter ginsengisoli]|uniref:Phenylacetic acid degradation operon negative regulatory protein n=1 Tax=Arthrobacter ginsengisoli TaxID=1356565 RepID=A0ABU1UFC7_9MICC|nr:PaaX family transcriptional regulator C-terminal domain-containing protein [Arthrobacter ginsengisoli]MDR7083886.1 phenylacetic acid degradation operon negative regulatory protein [Arthrobacter ginsengisoli]